MAKVFRKIGCGVVLLLLVVIVVGVVVLNNVLKNRLTPILNDKVLPPLEEKMKVDMSIGGASVNIVGGSVNIDDVKVGNPKGFGDEQLFTLKRLAVDLGMGRLFRALREGTVDIEISEVAITDANLGIIKNSEGLLNLKVLADNMKGEEKPAEKPKDEPTDKPEEGPKKEGPAELPKVWLKTLGISTAVGYVDRSKDEPLEIKLAYKLALENISTYETEAGPNGTISITGALAGDEAKCTTDLKGTIAPIVDPLKATFDISGDIGNVDLAFAMKYLVVAGISSCQSLGVRVGIATQDGAFAKESNISLVVKGVVVTGELGSQLAKVGMSVIPELALPFPISGTLAEPETPKLEDVFVVAVKAIIKQAATGAVANVAKGALSGLLGGKDGDKGATPDVGSLLGEKTDGGEKGVATPDVGSLLGGKTDSGDKDSSSPLGELVPKTDKKIKLPSF